MGDSNINYYSRIKKLFHRQNNQNNQQYVILLTNFITEFISITISNLALWFIQQSTDYSYDTILNLSTLEWYIILLMLVNIISLLSFTVLYVFELQRELWLIRTFDYSKRYTSLHLTKYKKDYPDLFSFLEKLNYRYYILYQITKWCLITNIVCSVVIINYSGYNGYKTITTLFTNFIICCNKVKKGLEVCKESISNGIGYSYFNMQNLSYNRIDARIKKHISNSNVIGNLSSPNSRLHSRRNSSLGNSSGSGSNNNSLQASFNSSESFDKNNDNNQKIIKKHIPIIKNIDELDILEETVIDYENEYANQNEHQTEYEY